MSESRFLAVMDAIDWFVAAQREAVEKQRLQFTFGALRAAGGSENEFDWTISPARTAYAAFLSSLKASGFDLVPLSPTPEDGRDE